MGILGRKNAARRAAAFLAALLWLAAYSALPVPARAGAIELNEQKIKAGLIYNFLKYTTWPDGSSPVVNKRIRVCLFGGDSFDGYLSPMQGRTAQQYRISIVTVRSAADAGNCSVLFIGSGSSDQLDGLLRALAGKNILTISDIPGFAAAGGMIELSKGGERVHLNINNSAIRSAGLHVQDRMLRLAEDVR